MKMHLAPLALAPLLVLAACGSQTAPAPSEGQATRAAMDADIAKYQDCVLDHVKGTATVTDQHETANEAFTACRPLRETLAGEVLKFRRLGYPSEDMEMSKAVADQSVSALDVELRDQALVAAVTKKLQTPVEAAKP